MKKISIAIVIFLFFSCKEICKEYIIENKTDKNLEIISFKSDTVINYNEPAYRNIILASSSFVEARLCSSDGGDSLGYLSDSIQVKADGVLVKTYYPNDKGKSIFKTRSFFYGDLSLSSWKLIKSKGSQEKYVFEITEEDLK